MSMVRVLNIDIQDKEFPNGSFWNDGDNTIEKNDDNGNKYLLVDMTAVYIGNGDRKINLGKGWQESDITIHCRDHTTSHFLVTLFRDVFFDHWRKGTRLVLDQNGDPMV